PAGTARSYFGLGSSVQAEPGLRSGGTGALSALRQGWHEPEPGGGVLRGHLSPAGPGWRPRPGRARRHRAVVRLDAQEVVITHPQIVSWRCCKSYATTNETLPALLLHLVGGPGYRRAWLALAAISSLRGRTPALPDPEERPDAVPQDQ